MIMSSSMNAAVSLKSTLVEADRRKVQTQNIVKAVCLIVGFAFIEAKIQRLADQCLDTLLGQPDGN